MIEIEIFNITIEIPDIEKGISNIEIEIPNIAIEKPHLEIHDCNGSFQYWNRNTNIEKETPNIEI